MSTRLFDAAGRPVLLGREVGRGGEGSVFDLPDDPASLAKVYHEAVKPDRVDKLAAMSRLSTPDLLRIAAWPTTTLHLTAGGELRGFVMPKVAGHREVHELYSPAQRKLHYPRADFAFLAHVAMNTAAAFETIHSGGHVVGDVNQSGVLVNDKGTVRLIDTDSFQVRSSGRLFPCIVGVPLFTPPELQGKGFRGIQRTAAHDGFGLALLVFHLLFVGRHPFAGIFGGSDDMPIERAITEGRFAFGRRATTFLMRPPPHSLPLSAMPPRMADLFERAFSLPSAGTTRPTAAQWRVGLEELKRNLRTCSADGSHRYPNHLAACPWCDLMRGGGPNFFVSVSAVIGGVTIDLPIVDFNALWRPIEALSAPTGQRPTFPTRPTLPRPTPLPENLQDQVLMLKLTRITTGVSLVLMLVATGAGFRLVGMVGLVLAIVFGVWWIVMLAVTDLGKERAMRRARAVQARGRLSTEQGRWDQLHDTNRRRFHARSVELRHIRDQGLLARSRFEAERRRLAADRRQQQLTDFLDRQFIRDHKIEMIGKVRLDVLRSFGIETAADLSEPALVHLPGFGDLLVRNLMEWRAAMIQRFVFDPSQPAPTQPLLAAVARARQEQQACEAELAAGHGELAQLTATTERQLCDISAAAQRLFVASLQAAANEKAI